MVLETFLTFGAFEEDEHTWTIQVICMVTFEVGFNFDTFVSSITGVLLTFCFGFSSLSTVGGIRETTSLDVFLE